MIRALSVLAVATACATDYPPEPFELADTAVPRCMPSGGATYPVTVTGTVVDFATRAPIAGAPIDIAQAWGTHRFPSTTCSIASTVSAADGRFALQVNVPGTEPGLFAEQFLVFMVQSDALAPLASDNRIACDLSPGHCAITDHVLPVPSRDTAYSWRQELRRGGMDHTWTRGLIAFEFRDRSRRPVYGVTPYRFQLFGDDDELEPGHDVRFLDEDRSTLRDPDLEYTTGSGLALISPPYNEDARPEIGGTAGAVRWPSTGCLIGDGWIFVEDRQVQSQ